MTKRKGNAPGQGRHAAVEITNHRGPQGPHKENEMKTIILSNSFHNTEATVRPVEITSGRFCGLHKISRKTALRLRRELCGFDGCVCGGTFGERGGAKLDVVDEDCDRNYIIDMRSSNV